MSGSGSNDEVVVLVHGLWLHGSAMQLLAWRLTRRGYSVRVYSYPTVRLSHADNAGRLAQFCESLAATRVNFVAHSMGGLVSIEAARHLPESRRGRVVVAGTPFADSYSARRVQRLPGGRALLGRCLGECIERGFPSVSDGLEIGVIAGVGRIGLGRIFAPGLPLPNDGVVSLAETHIDQARDRVTLHTSHTAMLFSREVAHQADVFLQHGRFDHAAYAVAA